MEYNEPILLEGFDKLDLIDLKEDSEFDVEIKALGAGERHYGEPGTIIALIAVGVVVLPVVILWMIRKRKRFTIKETEEIKLPDGTIIKRSFKLTQRESGPADKDIIDAAAKYKVDPAQLAEALQSSGQ